MTTRHHWGQPSVKRRSQSQEPWREPKRVRSEMSREYHALTHPFRPGTVPGSDSPPSSRGDGQTPTKGSLARRTSPWARKRTEIPRSGAAEGEDPQRFPTEERRRDQIEGITPYFSGFEDRRIYSCRNQVFTERYDVVSSIPSSNGSLSRLRPGPLSNGPRH